MSVAAGLVSLKTSNGALNTLIGTRFNPDSAPQGVALPFVVYTCETRTRYKTFGVALPALSSQTVMMKCYAATSVLRSALASAVLTAFCSTTSQTAGSVTFQGIEIDNQLSGGTEQ